MTEKNERLFFILLRVFISLAVVGLLVLVVTSIGKNPSDIAFSLIAFIISVAALVMTTLQSVSIAKQVRITNHAARLVRETGEQLEKLVKEERLLEREIRRDLAVDEEIVTVLEEYGIGNSESERLKVAARIAEKVGNKVAQTKIAR